MKVSDITANNYDPTRTWCAGLWKTATGNYFVSMSGVRGWNMYALGKGNALNLSYSYHFQYDSAVPPQWELVKVAGSVELA